jgi:hypothetical protein
MAAVAMALAMEAAQAQPLPLPLDNKSLYLNQLKHCGLGKPQPGGDVPIKMWRREMRLCEIEIAKVDKILVDRYPPPDPRKRE